MQSYATRLLSVLAIVLGLAALAAPTATAGRFGPGTSVRSKSQRAVHIPLAICHQYCTSVDEYLGLPRPGRPAPTPRIVTVTSDGGFHWTDAAVGFAAAVGLGLLAAGTIMVLRHSRVRQTGHESSQIARS